MTTSATGATVSARDLSVRYSSSSPETRAVALDGVNFDLSPGEVLAVVGESGSGKSTLARVVALDVDRLDDSSPRISGGELNVLGARVRGISPRRRSRVGLYVGYVPQEAGDRLQPRLTVGENVAEPIYARDRRFNQNDAGEAVATVIDAVRLPLTVMNRYPHELSKGQRQRVAIARAMILEPKLLVADDPTAGIDVTARRAILDIIVSLQRERGFSTLIVTADLAEVRRVSTRVAIMHRGVIVASGQLDEVLATAEHPYVKGLARSQDGGRWSAS
ncbi:ABC-type dipeptide/oligopeptide/nickel transport system, ATPase component [Salinibacterium xinjiangense]|uniref:ABC-type dipeptide/oligopeptide/nickel transport system, ATPase component n=1 Tax=Salinibacterium xinjiangense TaxID=386302 RepID=A0A2C8ZN07_9MICO|nr:dipeptide/oligopeptide/nickel ABC transporter ATP-binding protein [Salinibacterium xinjiangense]SOE66358.1 ABC-type dipeptide/oligopeptide/nickel transport system, ATPase component [Salinibacterium xinjiangense]